MLLEILVFKRHLENKEVTAIMKGVGAKKGLYQSMKFHGNDQFGKSDDPKEQKLRDIFHVVTRAVGAKEYTFILSFAELNNISWVILKENSFLGIVRDELINDDSKRKYIRDLIADRLFLSLIEQPFLRDALPDHEELTKGHFDSDFMKERFSSLSKDTISRYLAEMEMLIVNFPMFHFKAIDDNEV